MREFRLLIQVTALLDTRVGTAFFSLPLHYVFIVTFNFASLLTVSLPFPGLLRDVDSLGHF